MAQRRAIARPMRGMQNELVKEMRIGHGGRPEGHQEVNKKVCHGSIAFTRLRNDACQLVHEQPA